MMTQTKIMTEKMENQVKITQTMTKTTQEVMTKTTKTKNKKAMKKMNRNRTNN